MRFSEKAYAYGLKDKGLFPTVPASEDDARDQFQSMFNQILKLLNELVGELENAKVGESGADRIGSGEIGEVAGLTIREQMIDLKKQIDDSRVGIMPEGSIVNSKLSTDIKVGSLAALTTTAKSSLQEAVNELDGEIGDLSLLTTAEKSTLVGAINQINNVPVTESKITDGAVTETKIGQLAVTTTKIGNGAVTETKIGQLAVTNAKIGNGAVTTNKIGDGQVTQSKLGTIQQITLDTGDTLVYDNTNGMLRLKVAECLATNPNGVQLAPIVFGPEATPPAGTYPAGTLYIQYV